MKSFLIAVGFFTRIPIPQIHMSEKDWKKSVLYYPVVGVIIGTLLYLMSMTVANLFTPSLQAVMILIFWVWLTGGLHLDGWMDLADGLGSNRTPGQMIEIMKDSRVGAMGAISAFMLLIMKIALIHEILLLNENLALLFVPVIARFIILIAIKYFPYLSSSGLGTGLNKHITLMTLIIYSVVIMLYIFSLFIFFGVAVFITSLVSSLGFLIYVKRRLGGLNGDCYGAVIEWTEVVAMLLFVVGWGLVA